MEIKSHYRPISSVLPILSLDVPIILSEGDWAETIVARSRDGHGMAYRIPRKPAPKWIEPKEIGQIGVYPIRDSYDGSSEEFPVRHFPSLEEMRSPNSQTSRWSVDSGKAIEIKKGSRLRRLLKRISQIF